MGYVRPKVKKRTMQVEKAVSRIVNFLSYIMTWSTAVDAHHQQKKEREDYVPQKLMHKENWQNGLVVINTVEKIKVWNNDMYHKLDFN